MTSLHRKTAHQITNSEREKKHRACLFNTVTMSISAIREHDGSVLTKGSQIRAYLPAWLVAADPLRWPQRY